MAWKWSDGAYRDDTGAAIEGNVCIEFAFKDYAPQSAQNAENGQNAENEQNAENSQNMEYGPGMVNVPAAESVPEGESAPEATPETAG